MYGRRAFSSIELNLGRSILVLWKIQVFSVGFNIYYLGDRFFFGFSQLLIE